SRPAHRSPGLLDRLLVLAGALLPHADDVPSRVAERRDAQVAFGIGSRLDLCALRDGLVERLTDALDEDVRPVARVAGRREVAYEVPDYVAGSILERRVVAVAPHRPAEHGFVERRRRLRIRGRNPDVRDPAGAEDG